jgi:hypothetical protein
LESVSEGDRVVVKESVLLAEGLCVALRGVGVTIEVCDRFRESVTVCDKEGAVPVLDGDCVQVTDSDCVVVFVLEAVSELVTVRLAPG